MTFFDWFDCTLVALLYGAAFWFGGTKWRWLVTVSFLAGHLIMVRVAMAMLDDPVQAIALIHAGFALLLIAYSETNYGRFIGVCFLQMLALDGLAIAGILSPEHKAGLHWNYWNFISALQHVQAAALMACFWRHRQAQWKTV